MTRFCVKNAIIEKLKEQDFNTTDLLQMRANTYNERSRFNKNALLLELQKTGLESIESMKETIRRAHNKDIKELAERSLQNLEELQKDVDEALGGYND